MKVKEVLQLLDLGNSVAEHDAALEKYFIETETMRLFVNDKVDIVAGDKGTGKTALYKIVIGRYTTIPELKSVEVVSGFNPAGNPVFQQLAQGELLEEGQYITVWKAYVLALVGNWILTLNEGVFTDSMFDLDKMLRQIGLRSADDSPNTIFPLLMNLFRRLVNPRSAELTMSVSPQGLPIVAPKVEFGEAAELAERLIPHDEALGLLNKVLDDVDLSIWVVLDRLDEAFIGFPKAEIPALRALFRTYLDLLAFPRIRLKLFVRKDLFRRIVDSRFVNLTHVNARKVEIQWDEDDLRHLLGRRIASNEEFVSAVRVKELPVDELFDVLFPPKVDAAEKKPTTWNWIMARIRDGNGVRPPRNLIDIANRAREIQLRKEQRSDRDYVPGQPLIEPESIKRGLAALSDERVNDTLLAEAGDEYAALIERFRGGKAEQNEATIAAVLGLANGPLRDAIKGLMELGFLEHIVTSSSYKVPMLYRAGLGITQGRAFDLGSATEDDES